MLKKREKIKHTDFKCRKSRGHNISINGNNYTVTLAQCLRRFINVIGTRVSRNRKSPRSKSVRKQRFGSKSCKTVKKKKKKFTTQQWFLGENFYSF